MNRISLRFLASMNVGKSVQAIITDMVGTPTYRMSFLLPCWQCWHICFMVFLNISDTRLPYHGNACIPYQERESLVDLFDPLEGGQVGTGHNHRYGGHADL